MRCDDQETEMNEDDHSNDSSHNYDDSTYVDKEEKNNNENEVIDLTLSNSNSIKNDQEKENDDDEKDEEEYNDKVEGIEEINDNALGMTEPINYDYFEDEEYIEIRNRNNSLNREEWMNMRRNNIEWLRRNDIESNNVARASSNVDNNENINN